MSRLQEAKDLLARTEGHTPGLWSEHIVSGDQMHYENPESRIQLNTTATWAVGPQSRGGRVKWDAALIAAAPDLRELLAAMVAEVERLGCNIRVEAGLAWEEGFDSGSLAHENSGNYCDWEEAEERLKDEAYATWAFSWRPQ